METTGDSVVDEVIAQHATRAEMGRRKYGVTLDRDDLIVTDWLEHACCEAMDEALYLKKARNVWRKELNKRAEIEQAMLDAGCGKCAMPDAYTLRLWALALGTPKEHWTEEIKRAMKRVNP